MWVGVLVGRMCPRGGRGQRAKRAGVGGGWPAKKVREWAKPSSRTLGFTPRKA